MIPERAVSDLSILVARGAHRNYVVERGYVGERTSAIIDVPVVHGEKHDAT